MIHCDIQPTCSTTVLACLRSFASSTQDFSARYQASQKLKSVIVFCPKRVQGMLSRKAVCTSRVVLRPHQRVSKMSCRHHYLGRSKADFIRGVRCHPVAPSASPPRFIPPAPRKSPITNLFAVARPSRISIDTFEVVDCTWPWDDLRRNGRRGKDIGRLGEESRRREGRGRRDARQ